MAKVKSVYICNQCGFETSKWNGKCPSCNEWNTLEEGISVPKRTKSSSVTRQSDIADKMKSLDEVDMTVDDIRYLTGIRELDRVLGGGLVKGSLVLLGGEPGIGKSTLLLQICQNFGREYTVLYISGEESLRQIKLRAHRLNVDTENLYLLTETDAEAISTAIVVNKPDIVIIDSIQTMSMSEISSSPGSITQVRECTNLFMHTAKSAEIPIIIVGHVNKDGAIAGPKVMEHIVDAVLYFEGQRNMPYRILRAAKNRFGSTNEVGIFEMEQTGLQEVENPSLKLLSDRPTNVSGSCVACVMEGSRPILAEIQALVTKSGFTSPRRMATGFDYNRMTLIIAVLEKRIGFFFGNLDVYINIVGGLRVDEPAADLSIALALISGITDKPIDEEMIAFGELGLGGELRSITNINQRVLEAKKLGFKKCIIPKQSIKELNDYGIDVVGVETLKEAQKIIFG